jgi:transposase
MSPLMRQSVTQMSAKLGIHVVTLYNWRKVWRLQGVVGPASEQGPEGLSAAELSTYCREQGLFLEGVERWRQAAQDDDEKPVLTL